ncbi:beta strand repeat-containing protein [Gimesia panareensis]|uniref:beta strand repeat-containing protein n=1 Tax=Gimesia panareensis TaxID=2527978 RepID=UPI0011A6169E|nr:hypothetical protein [Gimesia panareensis]
MSTPGGTLVYGSNDIDTFNIIPSQNSQIIVAGGDPAAPASPGDTLVYHTPPGETATPATSGTDSGTISFTGGYQNISYSQIETTYAPGVLSIDGTGSDDELVINATGADSGTYQLNGGPVMAFSGLTSLIFNGSDGDDRLVINNPTGSVFDPIDGIIFNGGTGGENGDGDVIEINGGSASSVDYEFTNATDGKIYYDGEATATITYTGLEPISDSISAGDRIFSFTGGTEVVTVSDDGVAGNGYSKIVSTLGEGVKYFDASTNVIIKTTGGSGTDAVHIEGVDSTFDANLTIQADSDDTVTFQNNASDINSGDLDITAGSIALNAAFTTSGNVSLNATGGSISGGSLLSATNAHLEATGNVGSGVGSEVNLAITALEADVNGSLYVKDTDALNIGYGGTLTGVTVGGASRIETGSTLTVKENITASNGNLQLENTVGNFQLNSGVTISNGAYSVDVDSASYSFIYGTVQTNAGEINLRADTGLILGAASVVDTTSGTSTATVTLAADYNNDNTGEFTQSEGGLVDAHAGTLNVTAYGNAYISDLKGATVQVKSKHAAVYDNTSSDVTSLTATNAYLEAGTLVNVNTAVSTLAGRAQSGQFLLSNTGALSIGTVSSNPAGVGATQTTPSNGKITITADSIALNQEVTASGNVSLNATAGSITGAGLVTGFVAQLQATGNAGGSGTELNLAAGVLEADVDGTLYVDNSGQLQIGYSGGLYGVTVGGAAQITSTGRMAVTEKIAASGGNLKLENTGGDFWVNSGITISNGAYSIEVDSANDLAVNGTIQTSGGAISLLADRHLTMGTNGVVDTTSNTSTATVTLTADADHNNTGYLFQQDGSVVNAQAGTLNATAYEEIYLADLRGTTVMVDSAAGAILDNTVAEDPLITAASAYLEAGTSVGTSDDINTSVATIAGRASLGQFRVSNSSPLTIGTVTGYPAGVDTTGGGVIITASGALQVSNDVTSVGDIILKSGDTSLTGDDLTIGADVTVQSTGSTVILEVGDKLYLNSTASVISDTSYIHVNLDFGNADGGVGGVAYLNGTLNAATSINMYGNSDDDQVIIDGNGGGLNNGGTVDGVESLFSFNGYGGTDELIVDDSGDTTSDTVTILSAGIGSGSLSGAGTVSLGFEGLENLTFYAGSAADDITVNPNALTTINIVGGDPAAPTMPADKLTYLTPSGESSNLTPTGAFAGTISATGGYQDVQYDQIENLSMSGELKVTGTSGDDTLTITATSANSGSYQIGSGPVIDFTGVTKFTFEGGDGDDKLVINNPTTGVFAPTGGIFFDGQGQTSGDSLEIVGGTAGSVEHEFLNDHDGYVYYNGSPTATITYTGLEPVSDTILANDRTFSFLGGAETITLSDDGDVGDGESQIDSDLFGEVVTFLNATNNVIIKTTDGTGADNVNIEGVDSLFDADLTVQAGTDDTTTFQSNPTDIGSGDLEVTAGSIALNTAFTTTGNVALNANNGSITGTSLITANNARLEATGDVGASGTEVELAVSGLEADVTGSLYVNNTGALSIGYAGGSLTGVSVGAASTITSTGTLSITEDITETGFGTVHVESTGGNVQMTSGTKIDGSLGDLEVVAGNDVQLSLLTTSANVSVTATSGAITDINGGSNNINATNATLLAGTGAGVGDALETTITAMEANTGAGLYVDNTGYLYIGFTGGINGVTVGAASRVASTDTMLVTEDITATGGNLQLESTGGSFSQYSGTTISNDTHSIEVDSASVLSVHDTIQTTGGEISLRADDNLILYNTSVVDTTSGTSTATVTLSADDDGNSSGEFRQYEGSLVDAQVGTLNVTAYGNIYIADLQGDTVQVDSAALAIIDYTSSEDALITASNAYLEAGTAIGGSDDIDTAVGTLAGRSQNGDFQVSNTGSLTIGTVSGYPAGVIATNGAVTITTFSPLTVASNVTAAGTVTLTATDNAGPAMI